MIELGRQLWRDHKVKSETFAKAKAIFGPNKLVELVMLMGNYAGTAALLTAVDMQLHAGKRNRCCRSPDARVPAKVCSAFARCAAAPQAEFTTSFAAEPTRGNIPTGDVR